MSSLSLLFSSLSQSAAQASIERILNSLPEGILIAVFAWVLLRVLSKQNSGTRFAVWFLALLTVAVLPLLGSFGGEQKQGAQNQVLAGMSSRAASWGNFRPAIHIPAGWGMFLFFAWAVGASVAMTRLALGLWQLRGLRRSCTPIITSELDPAVRKTVEAIAGSGKSVTIASSECVRVPAAIGFWKRTIILPAWALRELAPEDLNVILLHEFAHLRRGDDWTNLVQKIVRALFFFHPAVWWIDSRLSVEREMACDDAVLAQTANPQGYASCLVSLLERSLAYRVSQQLQEKRWSMAQAAVRRAHEASLRLAQILDRNRPMATRVWKPAVGMVSAFSLVCLMALPVAPQFVAFDRDSGPAYAASVLSQDFVVPAATVVPASFRIGESSSVKMAATGASAKVRKLSVVRAQNRMRDSARTLPVVARVAPKNEEPPRDQLVAVRAGADPAIIPQFQTLVFFETTQYTNSDSNATVWSVQVWRVTFVTEIRKQMEKIPPVKVI
jgi:beta-lactamase regulating signal transducer with metallopeptidase domain